MKKKYKYIPRELKIGTRIEGEHRGTINWLRNLVEKNNKFPTNKQIQSSISGDHIKEFSNYYTRGIIPMEKKLQRLKSLRKLKGGK